MQKLKNQIGRQETNKEIAAFPWQWELEPNKVQGVISLGNAYSQAD
jgi:hypothetical protein